VRLLAVGILAVALIGVLPLLWLSLADDRGVVSILIAAGAVLFGLLSVRSLMPLALVLVVLTADALGVFGDRGGDVLPYVQVFGGVRVTLRDGLLILGLPLALMQLVRRREAPVYIQPYLAVLGTIAVGFVLGILSDADVKAPLNTLRPLFGYALYLILIAAVDTRGKLLWLLGASFGVAVVAVGIQVVEAGRGGLLPFLAPPIAAGQAFAGVSVEGRQVPYIWNRAVWQLFLTLLLALGGLLEWRAVRLHLSLALVCALGFGIMLTRSWYIFIGVGVLAILFASRAWSQRLRFLAAMAFGLVTLALLATVASELTSAHYGGSLADVWLARVSTLLSVSQDQSFVTRVSELGRQWQAVLAAPVLGYGMSADAQRLSLQVGNLDTGAVNTLLMFGFVGTAAFVALVCCAAWSSLRLARRLAPSWQRGYAIGLFGLWVGVLVGYAFNYDFLTYPHGPWLVVLGLTIGDRLERLGYTPVD
jgi:hypothetical protein